ncbi:MAG TPA: hypothetical protein VGF75_02255 [Candidatus Saccharimonadales bacterium]|jgi:hypothetical protein
MKTQKLKASLRHWLFLSPLLIVSLLFVLAVFSSSYSGQTLKTCDASNCQVSGVKLANGCGSGSGFVTTSIDFGCDGNACSTTLNSNGPNDYCTSNHNGITDLLFAVIRFLSDGVGLVVIVSVIIGGIQYITSRGDPNATQAAVKRLTSAATALLIFIFAYAILNYVVPGTFFKQ